MNFDVIERRGGSLGPTAKTCRDQVQDVGQVISELAARQSEVGLAEVGSGGTHARRVVSDHAVCEFELAWSGDS